MILGIVFGVIFLTLVIWLCIKYFILIGTFRITNNAFRHLHPLINKRYNVILDILQNNQNISSENINLKNETIDLINKALNYNQKKDGVDRIIRFANAIFDNAERLTVKLDEDNEFNIAKKSYNDQGKKLRHCVDVFPTSLMARFANIKFMDSLK